MSQVWREDEIEALLWRLRSGDDDDRVAAAGELADRSRQLSSPAGLMLLTAAGDAYPPLASPVWEDVPTALISAAATEPRAEYIPVIEQAFAGLSLPARAAALTVLARCEERAAALAYVRLVRAHLANGGITDLRHWPFAGAPRDGDVFFPELLDYAADPAFTTPILSWALTYLRAGAIAPAAVRGHGELILASCERRLEALRSKQQDAPGAWMSSDEYGFERAELGMLLDLVAFVDDPRAVSVLQAGLALTDPSVRLWAAIGLLNAGVDPGAEPLAAIAAWPETRTSLYGELERLGQLDRFPPAWATQHHLAEGDMVSWLAYPTELGQPPDEIELIATVPVRYADDTGDFFVYRFRTSPPHWAADDGWQAGVSGPYRQGALTCSPGGTFSDFKPADSRSAEEHVRAIRAITGA